MTIVVAHRGASVQAPENTMDAYRLAVEAGADAIELDVHLSTDGQLAVIHDDTVDRTTDGTGAVAGFSMKALRRFDAGHGFAGPGDDYPYRGQGLRIPTFGEVLEWLPEGIGLVVEIKARAAADAVVEALRGTPVRRAGAVSVISFDEPAIERVHELDPELTTGYLLVPSQPFEPALRWAVEHGHLGVHPWDGDLGMDPAPMMAQAMAYGRRLGCYVVNDPERMKQLAIFGLWGFVTDVPDVARAALGPRQA
ncbi:MAG TPA: glycerophosphodiester phosphodiesterase family protein [Candidatus Limnocylindrales bacterium]|nr:glycerophosphodiester phosphodiesterase family protein [Candidatus Limnocylindrales bacterium]